MGIFSKFEGKMEDGLEGAADRFFDAPISPVQISKKAEKAMRREKMVGAGKQYAPTLYTVLVNVEDDRRLFGYYPTLAGETETYLAARAAEEGLLMDGQPLVRFITDESLKHGKIDVIAELVSAPIVAQLREEEMERYGLLPQPQRAVRRASVPANRQDMQQADDDTIREAQARAIAAQEAAERAAAEAKAAQARAAAAQRAAIEAAEATYRERVRRASQSFSADSLPLVEVPQPESVLEPLESERASVPLDIPEIDDFSGLDVSTYEPYGDYDYDEPQRQSNTTEFAAGNAGVNPIPDRDAVRAYLVFESTNRKVDLASNRLILGRSSGSDIVLDDINASRTHAELRLEPQGAWCITDLGSMNGTYLNGHAITQAMLTNGDRIVIGSTDLFFVEE